MPDLVLLIPKYPYIFVYVWHLSCYWLGLIYKLLWIIFIIHGPCRWLCLILTACYNFLTGENHVSDIIVTTNYPSLFSLKLRVPTSASVHCLFLPRHETFSVCYPFIQATEPNVHFFSVLSDTWQFDYSFRKVFYVHLLVSVSDHWQMTMSYSSQTRSLRKLMYADNPMSYSAQMPKYFSNCWNPPWIENGMFTNPVTVRECDLRLPQQLKLKSNILAER